MKKFRLALVSLFLLLLLAPWGYAAQVDLKILYVNDFHGFAEPDKPTGADAPLGGIAYLAGAVDRARAAPMPERNTSASGRPRRTATHSMRRGAMTRRRDLWAFTSARATQLRDRLPAAGLRGTKTSIRHAATG